MSNNGFEWSGAMTDGGEKRREMHSPLYKYNQKRYAIVCQSFAHTKFLPDAIALGASLSVSVQMDSRL